MAREVALYKALLPHLGGVTFVTYGDASDLEFSARLDGIQIVCNRWRLPPHWYQRFLTYFPASWHRGKTIVKSNQMAGADLALAVASRLGKPFIARCGYLYSDFIEKDFGPKSVQASRAVALETLVFGKADRIVLTTEAMRQTVMRRYSVAPQKIRIIPNYVKTDHFAPRESQDVAKNHGQFRILFVGRLKEQKNLFTLFHAVAQIDVELWLVGDGPLKTELENLAKKNHINVRFFGNVPHDDLPHIMWQADLFILPSHYEGHPKALLEAMSCGMAVIGTHVPGIREVISHKKNGILCPENVTGIRQAIQSLMGDPQLRSHLGENARKHVLATVDLERTVNHELAVLREILID